MSLPVVAGCAPAPLSPAQLRSTAAAFALTSSKHLAQMGHFVVSCRRCVGSNSASSTLSAVMEISAVVRSKQMGELKRAAAVIAARIDWSRFAANAVERVEDCATSCSTSVVLGSAMRAGVVRAAAALLPSHVPPSPTVCHLEAAVFMRACSAVLAAPSGSTGTSGRSVASASCPPHIGLTPAAAFGRMIVSACIAASPAAAFAMQLQCAAHPLFLPRTVHRDVTWMAASRLQGAAGPSVVVMFTRETDAFSTAPNACKCAATRPPPPLQPLPITPMCRQAFPPFAPGVRFDAPLARAVSNCALFVAVAVCQVQPHRCVCARSCSTRRWFYASSSAFRFGTSVIHVSCSAPSRPPVNDELSSRAQIITTWAIAQCACSF